MGRLGTQRLLPFPTPTYKKEKEKKNAAFFSVIQSGLRPLDSLFQ